MKTKHTKGEWEFIAPAIVSTETKEDIALIKAMSMGTSRQNESLANAKLIAAAPNMLSALNCMKSVIDLCANCNDKFLSGERKDAYVSMQKQ